METPLQLLNLGIRNHSAISVSGRRFILTRRFNSWLNSLADGMGHQTVLERLFFNTVGTNNISGLLTTPPWQSNSVLVFCILLQLSVAHHLHDFSTSGISDSLLPLEKHNLRALFNSLEILIENLADEFFEIQWQFCAATLELDQDHEWPPQMILPFCIQNLIAQGRTARVFEVSIPEDFIGENLARAFPNCRQEDPEICPGWYYRFALKIFDRWNIELGKREMVASRNIESHEGFVRPLAAFTNKATHLSATTHTSNEAKDSYNILFEYCEVDLSDYFASKNPPVTSRDVEIFWTNISKIVDGVRQLHGWPQRRDSKAETFREHVGYHHDIKPSNILLSGGQFKLSDFGFASAGPVDEVMISPPESFGTVSYGPPEPNIYTRHNQTLEGFQKFDIWSLGCVLSESATWVVLGDYGVNQFRTLRQRILDKISTEREKKEPKTQSDKSLNIPRRGDYFHDGTNVLDVITSWHEFLRNCVRKSDAITSKVLDIVDQGLLVSNIKERFDSNTLHERLKCSIREGEQRARLLPRINTELEEFLREEQVLTIEDDMEEE